MRLASASRTDRRRSQRFGASDSSISSASHGLSTMQTVLSTCHAVRDPNSCLRPAPPFRSLAPSHDSVGQVTTHLCPPSAHVATRKCSQHVFTSSRSALFSTIPSSCHPSDSLSPPHQQNRGQRPPFIYVSPCSSASTAFRTPFLAPRHDDGINQSGD